MLKCVKEVSEDVVMDSEGVELGEFYLTRKEDGVVLDATGMNDMGRGLREEILGVVAGVWKRSRQEDWKAGKY